MAPISISRLEEVIEMGQQLRLIFVAILTISVIHTSYAGLFSNRYQVLSSNSFDREICQLRLYAVREFIETNDIIEKDVPKRKSRRNDKSFQTYGKHINIILMKKKSKCQRLLCKGQIFNTKISYL